MKHIFVINPCAGKSDITPEITAKINALKSNIDYQIYVTQCPGDATLFVRQWCLDHRDQPARFYACGGDGTLNEVVSGLIGFDQVQVTTYASGSGNDYIKYYGTHDDFNDLQRLIEGTPHQVDVMRVNDRYSINVTNVGFDARVCKTMNTVRRKPIIGGKHAYTTGVIKNLFTSMSSYCRLVVDGKEFHDAKMLLFTLSNGRYIGGSYQCARNESTNDDGLVEVNLFYPMTVFKLARLIGRYAKGTHFNLPNIDKLMKWTQGTDIEVSSHKPIYVCIDGELLQGTQFVIHNLHQAVTFVSPRP